ncbi:MAG: hypothetical protein Q7S47_01940 [bacterium]|nr:hypothetical protein [bacterium]
MPTAVLEKSTISQAQGDIPFLKVRPAEETSPGWIITDAQKLGAVRGIGDTKEYHLQLEGMLPKWYTAGGLRYLLGMRGVSFEIEPHTARTPEMCTNCPQRANCPVRGLLLG